MTLIPERVKPLGELVADSVFEGWVKLAFAAGVVAGAMLTRFLVTFAGQGITLAAIVAILVCVVPILATGRSKEGSR